MDLAELETYRCSVDTPSGPMSYLDVGHGRPAVFIHGIITNSLLWRRVIAEVASGHRRCIALDLPGHGHTPPATEHADVSLTGLAQRVIDLCNALGLDRFDLVANDTGGAIAQVVAGQLGQRLTTLTLTNGDTEGNTPPWLFKPVVWLGRPAVLGAVGPRIATRRALVRGLLLAGYQHVGAIPDEIVDAYSLPVLGTRESARAFARLMASLSSDALTAVRGELAALTVPTHLVWGTGDVFFPLKWGRRLADLIPGTTGITEVRGARMHFPDYRSADFVAPLREHWSQHNP